MSLTKGCIYLHQKRLKDANEEFERYLKENDDKTGCGYIGRFMDQYGYLNESFCWHKRQFEMYPDQKFETGLINCYMNGIGCAKNVRKGAKILYEKGLHSVGPFHLSDEDILIVSYVYGKHLIGKDSNIGIYSVHVFETSCEKALATVLYWLWFTKKYNLLVPDLRRVIGKRIWKSRKFPSIWGVKLK